MESVHTFHFFEIRPIIFSLMKDAKLGKLMCSKEKIIERYIKKVLSTPQSHVLKRVHENTGKFTICALECLNISRS